jgi:hypothetical protein
MHAPVRGTWRLCQTATDTLPAPMQNCQQASSKPAQKVPGKARMCKCVLGATGRQPGAGITSSPQCDIYVQASCVQCHPAPIGSTFDHRKPTSRCCTGARSKLHSKDARRPPGHVSVAPTCISTPAALRSAPAAAQPSLAGHSLLCAGMLQAALAGWRLSKASRPQSTECLQARLTAHTSKARNLDSKSVLCTWLERRRSQGHTCAQVSKC